MKLNHIRLIPLIFLILALTACGNPQEEARIKLAEMKVAYTSNSFVNATRTRNIEVVKLFLQAGMDPNATNDQGETALLNAARYGAQEVAEVLLAKGAKVEVTDPLIGGSALIWAATGGFDSMVKLLLDKGAAIEAKDNRQGVNALMAAANNGRTQTALLLLDRGADVDAQDNYYRTALIWAAQYGRANTAKALLEKGADTNFKETVNGRNALMVASALGKTDTALVLLDKGANLDARDNKGKTALMLAVQGGWPETAKLLVDRGANLDARDQEGNTALSLAQTYRQNDIVDMLKKAGANELSMSNSTSKYVQKINITGKIINEESGYYIQGQIPREIYIIHNPNVKILNALAKSNNTVVIEARIVLGDNVAIETIDGTSYQGDDE